MGDFDFDLDDESYTDNDDIFKEDSFNEESIDNSHTSINLNESESSNVKKKAIIGIIIGIAVILFVIIVNRAVSNIRNKDEVSINNKNNTNSSSEVNNVNNGNLESENGWLEVVENDSIAFQNDYVQSIFTVTNIKNYVKKVNEQGDLMIKTVLTGTISGFIGTYEIEIPYDKGSQLSLGNYFDVQVQVGEIKGKVIVGEIKY